MPQKRNFKKQLRKPNAKQKNKPCAPNKNISGPPLEHEPTRAKRKVAQA
jgi:hypothetical protein